VTEPVRLVLDASAVRKYPSFDVGEPICEICDEGAHFGVPIMALSAGATSAGHETVAVLIANDAFRPLDVGLERWRQLAVALSAIGDAAAAHAIVFAFEADCDILTARPELYAAFGSDPPIITIAD
jgi:hypothetical protein